MQNSHFARCFASPIDNLVQKVYNIIAINGYIGAKAVVTSSITAYIAYSSDLAIENGPNKLIPTYTYDFGKGIKIFFGWLDDALVYLWG